MTALSTTRLSVSSSPTCLACAPPWQEEAGARWLPDAASVQRSTAACTADEKQAHIWLGLTQTRAMIPHVTHMHIQPINPEEEEEGEGEERPPALRAGAGSGARILWGADKEQAAAGGKVPQDGVAAAPAASSAAAHAPSSRRSKGSELRPLQPLGVRPSGVLTT